MAVRDGEGHQLRGVDHDHRQRSGRGSGGGLVWSTHGERIQARQAVGEAFCAVREIWCCAPPEVVDARLTARRTAHDPSDATPEIARLMEKEFQSWPEAERLSTTGTVDQAVQDAVRLLAHPSHDGSGDLGQDV
jgi:hypothetical protein